VDQRFGKTYHTMACVVDYGNISMRSSPLASPPPTKNLKKPTL